MIYLGVFIIKGYHDIVLDREPVEYVGYAAIQ